MIGRQPKRLDDIAQRLEIAHSRLEFSLADQGSYHSGSREGYRAWADKQDQAWYSADRIRDHIAELRRVLRRVEKLRPVRALTGS